MSFNFKRKLDIRQMHRNDPTLFILIVSFVLIVISLSIFFPGRIITFSNLQSMAFQLPDFGILSLAMMITMLSGGINLSIIATTNMASIVSAFILIKLVNENVGFKLFLIILMAILAGWIIASLVGLLNGFIIAYIGVSPILATLGVMILVGGLNIATTKGYSISGFPNGFLYLGNGVFFSIPFPFIIFLILSFLISVLLRKTPFGISNYLIGSNEKASRFSGINIKRTIILTYMLSGFLCGIASTIMIARFNSAKEGYASSYLLITILAAVLGGVNPSGGFGKIGGLMLSLFILQLASSTFNILGLSSHLTLAIWGVLLLFTIGLRKIKIKPI